MSNKELADGIASALFTDGKGVKAERLVMIDSTFQNSFTGWDEPRASRVIGKILDNSSVIAPDVLECLKTIPPARYRSIATLLEAMSDGPPVPDAVVSQLRLMADRLEAVLAKVQ